jgi:nitrogen fixation NifU-like protein
MSGLSELYQEILLDHNSKPRNFRRVEDPSRTADGYNPLCGDQVTVYLKLSGGLIEDVAFQGVGCAISRASASMMTQSIKGKSLAEADEIFGAFHRMVTEPGSELDSDTLGDLETLSGVNEYPTRIKCAVLAWHTMRSALADDGETVTTE